MIDVSYMDTEYLADRAEAALSETDRRLWPLMRLGVPSYGEFGFQEAVERLTECDVPDPQGHLLLWLRQGHIYERDSIMRKKGAAFLSQEPLTVSLLVSGSGKTLAALSWPDSESINHTTFGRS